MGLYVDGKAAFRMSTYFCFCFILSLFIIQKRETQIQSERRKLVNRRGWVVKYLANNQKKSVLVHEKWATRRHVLSPFLKTCLRFFVAHRWEEKTRNARCPPTKQITGRNKKNKVKRESKGKRAKQREIEKGKEISRIFIYSSVISDDVYNQISHSFFSHSIVLSTDWLLLHSTLRVVYWLISWVSSLELVSTIWLENFSIPECHGWLMFQSVWHF